MLFLSEDSISLLTIINAICSVFEFSSDAPTLKGAKNRRKLGGAWWNQNQFSPFREGAKKL